MTNRGHAGAVDKTLDIVWDCVHTFSDRGWAHQIEEHIVSICAGLSVAGMVDTPFSLRSSFVAYLFRLLLQ